MDAVMRRVPKSSGWFVYMVRCADRSLYTGVTTDAKRRIAEHNEGRGARYTRSRGPVALVYLETVADRAAALRREHEIKRMTVAGKKALVAKARRNATAQTKQKRRAWRTTRRS